MDLDIIAPLLDWLTGNPAWAGLGVFLIAFFESLALVGLFLPGAVLMFGIGALIGSGLLELTPTLVWAAFGAIAGDGVSFWLGWRFHQRIRTVWPLRNHPALLAQSTDFFYRHGGKSILFGRFVGPIRPVIPLVAGMLEMPPARFMLVNVISGVLWAPVYVLPGMVFAASLGLAAEVATRLAMLLGLLFTLVLLLAWAIRRLFSLLHPRAHTLIARLLAWSELHPRLGEVPAALLDPEHREAKGLTLLALLLLSAAACLLWLLHAGGGGGLLYNLDAYLLEALHGLRTPAMDAVMGLFAGLGSPWVLGGVFTVVLLWLGIRRHLSAALHWLAAGGFVLISTPLLQWLTPPHPSLAEAVPAGGSETAYTMVVFGFLAILLGREFTARRRWLIYTLAGSLTLLTVLADLYLGRRWLSGSLGGLALGLSWIGLLGIAYRRHPAAALSARGLGLAAVLALALGAGLQQELGAPPTPARVEHPAAVLTQWWQSGWQALPAQRADLRGRGSHPLTLQYAGQLAALEALLAEQGWRRPVALSAGSWMLWFSPRPKLAELPVLPQVHDGIYHALLLVKPEDQEGERLLALRLWPSGYRLADGRPLWLGNASLLGLHRPWGLFAAPRTLDEFARPLEALQSDTARWPQRRVTRPGHEVPLLLLKEGTYSETGAP